jgi:hypothetical protein
MAAAQMDAGFQRRGQARIAGHHQHQSPRPADSRKIPPEVHSRGVIIVPQDNARSAAGQAGDRGTRIGKAGLVGEQPQAG